MLRKNSIRSYSIAAAAAIIVAALALASPARGAVIQWKNIKRKPDPIIVTGDQLPQLIGTADDRIGVFAYISGRLRPISFQIDARDKKGRLALPNGDRKNPEKEENRGIFDENDEVVFTARHLGSRIGKVTYPRGYKQAAEIEVVDPLNGSKGWAYAFSFDKPAERDDTDWVAYDAEQDTATTFGHTSQFSPGGNKVYYTRIEVPKKAGGNGIDIADRLKIRLKIKILRLITLNQDEDFPYSEVQAWKDGTIRMIRRGRTYFKLGPIKIPLGAEYDVIYYPDLVDVPIEIVIPFGVSRVTWRFADEFNAEAKGMKHYDYYNRNGFAVDGKMSEDEKNMRLNIDLEDSNRFWYMITGKQGTMLRRARFTQETIDKFKGITEASIYYVDDEEALDPPEEFDGQIGSMGTILDFKKIPMRKIKLHHYWIYPIKFKYPQDLDMYLNVLDHPVEVSARPGT